MNRRTIIAVILLILVLGGMVAVYISTDTDMHKNPDGLVGNTCGNLANKGLYCEYQGRVYFANHLDGGAIYSMTTGETDYKKVNSASSENINVDGSRVYYSMSGKSTGEGLGYIRKATGLYSSDFKGNKVISYTQDPVGAVMLYGNNLYFTHNDNKNKRTTLDRISISKKDMTTLIDDMVSPANLTNGVIYYANNNKDQYLYSYSIAGNLSSVVFMHNMYNPIYDDMYVYYIDLESNYHLRRYNVITDEDVEIVNRRVDSYNVKGGTVFYQTDTSSKDAGIYRKSIDTGIDDFLMPGTYTDINITSNYAYFHAFGVDDVVYHQSLHGPVSPTQFFPGVEK